MVTAISGQAHNAAQLMANARRHRNAPAQAAAKGDHESISKLDQALEALRSLNQANSQQAGQRKAAAKQKLERIKKQLEMLRMFGGSGNSKGIAREAARLARELKDAVKEYSSASGGDAKGGGFAAGSAEAGPVASEGEADQTAPSTATATATAAATVTDPATPDQKPEGEREALTQHYRELAAEREHEAQEKKADAEFAHEARTVQRQLKALIELQRKRASETGQEDEDFKRFAKDAEAADQAISELVDSIWTPAPPSMPMVNILT